MERRTGPDGETLFVDRTERARGSSGPFFAVYRDEAQTVRWGYACGDCGSLDAAMDTMGRVQCTACDNVKKPDEWDAVHG